MTAQNEIKQQAPTLIEGGIVIDDRGSVRFANDFDFAGVKRFYVVRNHQARTVRAWHAHKKEAKYVTVLQGAALIGAVEIDDWQAPSKGCQVHKFVLAQEKPSVLAIPPGFANGFMSLTDDTILIFFSSASLEESLEDDWRYPARHWDIWQVKER
ncbi:MAG: dTDP-4-dehydrorhamnose 3,5-epimerase family protein [Chloroflexota bacterium]|jgi:dTDP-4-dehydrorhamnose 3,5-epimerase